MPKLSKKNKIFIPESKDEENFFGIEEEEELIDFEDETNIQEDDETEDDFLDEEVNNEKSETIKSLFFILFKFK